MTGPITRETPIGDIVKEYPLAANALTGLGLHCLGCHASAFETIEQGLKVHGMNDEEVDEAIEKLNKIIKDNE
jgi:hybrid cluster-associated redox disulfide protein